MPAIGELRPWYLTKAQQIRLYRRTGLHDESTDLHGLAVTTRQYRPGVICLENLFIGSYDCQADVGIIEPLFAEPDFPSWLPRLPSPAPLRRDM